MSNVLPASELKIWRAHTPDELASIQAECLHASFRKCIVLFFLEVAMVYMSITGGLLIAGVLVIPALFVGLFMFATVVEHEEIQKGNFSVLEFYLSQVITTKGIHRASLVASDGTPVSNSPIVNRKVYRLHQRGERIKYIGVLTQDKVVIFYPVFTTRVCFRTTTMLEYEKLRSHISRSFQPSFLSKLLGLAVPIYVMFPVIFALCHYIFATIFSLLFLVGILRFKRRHSVESSINRVLKQLQIQSECEYVEVEIVHRAKTRSGILLCSVRVSNGDLIPGYHPSTSDVKDTGLLVRVGRDYIVVPVAMCDLHT